MNILMVNTLPIPSGQASVNRLLSLAKGLVEQKVKVTILSTGKGTDENFHCLDGVKYCNLRKNGNKIICLLKSLFDLLLYVRDNRNSINAVWLVSNSLLVIYPLWFICKLYKIPYVQEKSEFPFVLMKRGVLFKIWACFYTHTTYILFDGMIIMTQTLLDYFRPLVRKKCQLIKVPMTVDVSRFNNIISKNYYGDYAAYCGYMGGNKDGVENLLEAFTYVEKKYPHFKLVLAGSASSSDELERLKNKAQTLGLRNVVFTGRVHRDKIPALLWNAKILCLARPSSLQSAGGFPTKLGEYLCTGNPVVVTAVGDIPDFLNSTNSFIVEPDNNKVFGDEIIKVLDNYEYAKRVAIRGEKTAKENFDGRVQAVRLVEFFKKVIE